MPMTQDPMLSHEYHRMNEHLQQTLRGQRRRVEDLARLLSEQSLQQWQRAVEGLVSLPAAFVTSAAATTLYAVSFVTRGFEVFQEAALDSGRSRSELERREGHDQQMRGSEQQQLSPSAPRA
jgi:hypothetical protein